jgi:hypothetical protein
MFNNKFLKNDPLLEAVKAARADGDARRLAESMANDLFGVFSRKAVVREHLSDYDFALEEAYKCMKEEDKMADKDYDRDGKIETSKKEVWGSRLRAAKASGKYKGPVDEKKDCYEESDGLPPSDAAKQTQTPKSTPAPTKSKDLSSTFSSARGATGMQEEEQIDEISKELAGRYIKKADYKRSDSSFQSGKVYGKELATKRRTKQDVEDARKHNRDAYKREKGINTAVNKLTGRAKVAANEEVMKESIIAKVIAKHMKEEQGF